MPNDYQQFRERHVKSVPFSQFYYLDTTFPAAANTDHFIEHPLKLDNPELVRFEIVDKDRAADVYRDKSVTRRPWGAGYLLLRCSVASAQVRLRLSVEP